MVAFAGRFLFLCPLARHILLPLHLDPHPAPDVLPALPRPNIEMKDREITIVGSIAPTPFNAISGRQRGRGGITLSWGRTRDRCRRRRRRRQWCCWENPRRNCTTPSPFAHATNEKIDKLIRTAGFTTNGRLVSTCTCCDRQQNSLHATY